MGDRPWLEALTTHGRLPFSSEILLIISLEGVIGLQRPAAIAQLKITYPPGSGQGVEEARRTWASWLKNALGLNHPFLTTRSPKP